MAKPQNKQKPPKSQPKPQERDLDPLYVGEWIDAADKKQHQVVKATGIGQPYISNMSGGRRVNPSAAYLRRISQYLGISMDDFYRAPPPKEQRDDLRSLSPAARALLIDQPKAKAK